MVAIHPYNGHPSDGHQGDGLPSEAVWQLLAGMAHDSWEAICNSAHVDVELKVRAAGGTSDGAISSVAKPTPATTSMPVKAASTIAATPTVMPVVSAPTAESTPVATPAKPTTTEAQFTPSAAASTPAHASAAAGGGGQTGNNNGSPAGQSSQGSGNGNDTAAPAGQVLPSSSNGTNGNNNDIGGPQASQPVGAPATEAPAPTTTGSSDPNSPPVYVNAPGQTTPVQEVPTPTASGDVLVTASSAGLPSGSIVPSLSSSSPSKNGATHSSSGSSHVGAIAGVVVVLVVLLAAAAVLYRFRRAKAVRQIFGRGGNSTSNTGSKRNGNERLRGQSVERSSWTPFESSRAGCSQMHSMANNAVSRDNVSAAIFATYDEKQSQSAASLAPSTTAAANACHDSNDRHSRIDTYKNANLPPPAYPLPAYPPPAYPLPAYPAASATSSPRPTSVSSSVGTDDSDSLVGAPHGRARSASRGSYSTFPTAGRPAMHRHNSSTSVPHLQPAPALSSTKREDASTVSNLSSQPRVAVTVQLHSAPQVKELSAVNYYTAKTKPVTTPRTQPAREMTPSFSPLEADVLVPPPTVKTQRQRGGTESEREDVNSSRDKTTFAQSRASYGSIGGCSVASSMLMSPTLLRWPVPPQTPVTAHGDEGKEAPDLESKASIRASPVASSSMASNGNGAGSAHSPTVAGRGQPQTSAQLNKPSPRNQQHTTFGRQPGPDGVVVRGGSAGYSHIGQQQQQRSARQPYNQIPPQQYHHQQYSTQKGASFGYMQPNAPALTVHTGGQDTSVHIHIAQYQAPPTSNGTQEHFF
ncbi:hypothetical protein SEPCBS57363_001164 [Sporothrix epigloea]|uniref:Uncharacterized protein n=1 Tax=Sporothrix epigloea TaxID=1892477 RepID=A0ABP0D9T8_9PEZI